MAMKTALEPNAAMHSKAAVRIRRVAETRSGRVDAAEVLSGRAIRASAQDKECSVENILGFRRTPDFTEDWASAKPTRAEQARREQAYYERFGQPWSIESDGSAPVAALSKVLVALGALGALAFLAR